MKISSHIKPLADFVGEEKAIEMLAKAGFDYFDFSLFDMALTDWRTKEIIHKGHPLENENSARELARKVKEYGLKYGISCNQAHAPFPTNYPFIREKINLAIELAAIAGAKIIVIHPDNNLSAEENKKLFDMFLPTAKKFNIKIATENMWNWDGNTDRASFAACSTTEDFLKHLQLVNDPNFVACVDIGHAEMFRHIGESASNMIRGLGNYVQCLHIHDNDQHHDCHQLPGSMNINFDEVIDALVDINYDGDFTLEVDGYIHESKKEELQSRINEMYKAVRKLADQFEEKMSKKHIN